MFFTNPFYYLKFHYSQIDVVCFWVSFIGFTDKRISNLYCIFLVVCADRCKSGRICIKPTVILTLWQSWSYKYVLRASVFDILIRKNSSGFKSSGKKLAGPRVREWVCVASVHHIKKNLQHTVHEKKNLTVFLDQNADFEVHFHIVFMIVFLLSWSHVIEWKTFYRNGDDFAGFHDEKKNLKLSSK